MNRLPIVYLSVSLLAVLLAPLSVSAEDQSINPPDEIMNKPSPVLSPEEALKTFKLEEGFEIQLVASEEIGLVDPVCMAWDPDGRLWVAEMTTYMADQFANGEEEPKGNIVILEDTDGDGTMDTRKVFLDKIILPRALAFGKGGLFYADYQRLYFVRINSGDRPGAKIPVDTSYSNDGKAKSNVEHQANGLLYGLDNWYYNAKSSRRYKQSGARFRTDKATDRNPSGGTEFRGQWGITQDDDGRLLTNRNPILIEYELLPPSVTKRNPNFKFGKPIIKVSPNVWPAHATPGVNRAYQPHVVDHETWKLKVATAACGPEIYRGTQFPGEYYNNVFVPEPAGNLVKRIVLGADNEGKPIAKQAYSGKEFLTSTDERNRFVNAYTGPDGALYLVDLYRGLIQHQTYISEYLRRQINARQLDKPLGMGRIYRIVHKDSPIDHTPPKLSEMDSVQLVELLGFTNAWHRHTAQRLLVERRDDESIDPLKEMATTSDNPQARIHALWALEGMGKLEAGTLFAAGRSKDPRVRVQALRLSESFKDPSEMRQFVGMMQQYAAESPNWPVDMQLALTAGVLASIDTPQAYDVLLGVIERRYLDTSSIEDKAAKKKQDEENKLFLSAVVSGLRGKEAVMLAKVEDGPIKAMLTGALVKATESGDLTIGSLLELVDSPDFESQRSEMLNTLASQAVEGDKILVVNELIKKLASEDYTEENKLAILEGMSEASELRPSPMELDGKPDIFTTLQASAPDALKELVGKLDDMFDYERTELDPATLARIERGSMLYSSHCSTCHKDDGKGHHGAGPPLSPSNWVNASPRMLSALLLYGVKGPIEVNGKSYAPPDIQPEMVGFKNSDMTDQDFADILTFIRSKSFGNDADPVDPEVVASVRTDFDGVTEAFTSAELWAINSADGGTAPPKAKVDVVMASWLNHSSRNLVITLIAVTGPLILLLVGTLFAATLPKP
ncbi:MAG: PVC-type heme-binding CxxCH protein [Planctomycetota bacterium]